MARVASGGETARLMLALKSTLAHADATPTLIFDEIDQGIGGRVGAIVGQKLWLLTGTADASGTATPDRTQLTIARARDPHQVLCITHLPQLAAFGDLHYAVNKRVFAVNGEERTGTVVRPSRRRRPPGRADPDARRPRRSRPPLGRRDDGRGRRRSRPASTLAEMSDDIAAASEDRYLAQVPDGLQRRAGAGLRALCAQRLSRRPAPAASTSARCWKRRSTAWPASAASTTSSLRAPACR